MSGDEPVRPQTMSDRKSAAESALQRDMQKLKETHEILVVEKRGIPKGAKLIEAYETAREFVIMGWPEPDDENHNCDAMGCGTLSHVVARFPKDIAELGKGQG